MQPPKITLQTLLNYHRMLLDQEAGPEAQALYTSYPGKRGYAVQMPSHTARFDASLVIALTEAFQHLDKKVFFFVPEHLLGGSLERLTLMIKCALQKLSRQKARLTPERYKKNQKLIQDACERIELSSDPLFRSPSLDTCWAAYGFDARTSPAWLRAGLAK